MANIEHSQNSKEKSTEHSRINSGLKGDLMVGLPGFEPESIEPKSTSLDQASRQPHAVAEKHNFARTIKTLAMPQKTFKIPKSMAVEY